MKNDPHICERDLCNSGTKHEKKVWCDALTN